MLKREKNIEDDIDLISDESDEWSKILTEDGKLIADFNQDGYDDYIIFKWYDVGVLTKFRPSTLFFSTLKNLYFVA